MNQTESANKILKKNHELKNVNNVIKIEQYKILEWIYINTDLSSLKKHAHTQTYTNYLHKKQQKY